jgi:D-alanyl-D-alanine carboxypeptidase
VKQRGCEISRDVRHIIIARILNLTIAGVVACGLGFGAGQAAAARHPIHHIRHRMAAFAPGPVHESILIDAQTGQILSENNADALTYPASLTKMMTLYLTFKALNEGRLRLDTRLPVSAWAASQPPTKLGLRAGDTVSVRSLILGIVTRSANDAAVVLAEGLAGSEPAFAEEMNAEARRLGMTRTVFRNASGLPNPEQKTTARDMAQLALALYRDFPRECGFFATKEFNFRGTEIVGHDHLLNWYPGVDGIKTGFIRASGYNLATSAVRNGHRLIGVVLGGATWAARDREMAALLDRGFAALDATTPAVARIETPAPARPAPLAAATPTPQRTVATPAALPAARPIAAERGAAPHRPALPVARAAARFAARLSPVTRAQAAPLPRPKPIPNARLAHAAPAAPAGWSIQIGAFRNASAARQAARTAGDLRLTRGKPLEILPPIRTARTRVRLYRARLLRFTARDAESACAALRKRRIPCAVIPPPIRFARR